MGGSAWKVAYADFVTALMAFFLMMWVLNMVPPETKQGIAEYFQQEAMLQSGPVQSVSSSALVTRANSLTIGEGRMSEAEKSNYAIAQKLRAMLMADAVPQNASGLSADDVGIQLRVTNDAMFEPGAAEITAGGKRILESVLEILREYNVYIVVRGHADTGETENSPYPSPWELSAARGAVVARYLVEQGINPTRLRTVSYGATRPLEPGLSEESRRRNRRVEFHFHRPEAMTYSIVY